MSRHHLTLFLKILTTLHGPEGTLASTEALARLGSLTGRGSTYKPAFRTSEATSLL